MAETRNVGRVSRIVVYPVKSMKGVDLSQAACQLTGLIDTRHTPGGTVTVHDRSWMVTTPSYNFVTARQAPRLTTVAATVDSTSGNLHLNADGMPTAVIPKNFDDRLNTTASVWQQNVPVVDCGDEVAQWLSTFLNRGKDPELHREYRLVYHRPEAAQRRCIDGPHPRWGKTAKPEDQVLTQDGFPYMLTNELSLCDVNARLLQQSAMPVVTDNFRPNIVVADCTVAFAEDDWDIIYINDSVFRNIQPCSRCVLTTVTPDTGTGTKRPDKEPLNTLRQYRLLYPEFGKHPCFGINLVLEKPGTIRVGDVVLASRKVKD